jgi:hypothetical protein
VILLELRPRANRTKEDVYWWILIVVAIASGVGLVLFFSIPIFFSPGGGIGVPTTLEEEQQNHQQLEGP